MSIATLKRKTHAVYDKTHSHGKRDTIQSGFSIQGARRSNSYIGKERLVSKVSAIVPESRIHEYLDVKPSVVDTRQHLNKILWCCKDIVRTQSTITMGSQELYVNTVSAKNSACVTNENKPPGGFSCCQLKNKKVLNQMFKQVAPIDSSIRTLNIQQKCANMVVPDSKLFKNHNMHHCGGC